MSHARHGRLAPLGRFARPYSRVLALGGVLAVVEIALQLAQPWPLERLVDHVLRADVSPGRDTLSLTLLAILGSLLGIVASAALVDYWSTRILASAGLHIANDVRLHVFDHLQRLSLRFHQNHRVGDLTTRVTGDVDRSQELVVQGLSVLVPNTLLVLGMAIVMVLIDPMLSVLALGCSPLMVVSTFRATRALKHASRRSRQADGEVAAVATESLSAIGLVQTLSLEASRRHQFASRNDRSLRAGLEAVRLQARFSPVVDVTGVVSTVVVLWVGTYRVLDGRMALGVLLVFVSYLGSLYKPVKALAKLSTTIAKGTAASERVAAVLGEQPDVVDAPGAVLTPPLRGRIEWRDVSHSYGREPVLRHVQLSVEPGETLALVGPTGAGKSTIAALLLRLMDPSSAPY